jgi:hypothetical protein
LYWRSAESAEFYPQSRYIFKNNILNDKKLWTAFSLYIRARDADEQGICICFTCNRRTIWNKNTDCGHGIGRQHMSTKYNEKNNHSQCKKCNGFEGGMREKYKENMDKKYGSGTWDLMEVASKKRSSFSQFEIDTMEAYYSNLLKNIIKLKRL